MQYCLSLAYFIGVMKKGGRGEGKGERGEGEGESERKEKWLMSYFLFDKQICLCHILVDSRILKILL